MERQRQLIADLARDGGDTVLPERELAALMQGNEQLKESKARLLQEFPEHCKPETHATLAVKTSSTSPHY